MAVGEAACEVSYRSPHCENIRLYMSAFLSSGSGYALDEEGMRQCCNERCAHSISMAVPMGGHWCPHMSHNAAVAFSPVVAMARHWGMASSIPFMSEYFTTSRYLSLALSLRRITSQAVSYRAIPFCARNAVMASLSNRFASGTVKCVLSSKNTVPMILQKSLLQLG